ncbi:MAG TPA: FlgD immunoglobulin-like domain containing protein, partial [Flavitalea sp.]|nr:FlgD immunoglobulin-like domain containing protein [Flavitalea sp.]
FDNPANTFNFGATWSQDGKSIVFSSNRETDNFDFDIWTVRADGGVPKRLTGSQNKGDFDPAFSKNGKFVAYAGATDVLALLQENSFRLSQNFPNPLLTQTTISFELPEGSDVVVEIRDHNNRLIKTLTHDEYARGQHSITWDRTNQNGERVSSGYYYYTLRTPGFREVKRLVIED